MRHREKVLLVSAILLTLISLFLVLVPPVHAVKWCCWYKVNYADGTGCHWDYESNCVQCQWCQEA
jgi:hypothetical protein